MAPTHGWLVAQTHITCVMCSRQEPCVTLTVLCVVYSTHSTGGTQIATSSLVLGVCKRVMTVVTGWPYCSIGVLALSFVQVFSLGMAEGCCNMSH